MHYSQDQLDWKPIGDDGYESVSVQLARGDTAWNPGSTKPERSIFGPCTVTYERWRDGGVTASVR